MLLWRVRRWLALAVTCVGWLLVGLEPEVGAPAIGPGAAAWVTLASLAVAASVYASVRPSVTSIAVAGGLPVAIGLWRGALYLDLGLTSPLGVWLVVTGLSIAVTFSMLDSLEHDHE